MKANLTEKQLRVIELISRGMGTKDIAVQLGNTKRTIDGIRHEILRRTRVNNTAELMILAVKQGWIKIK